MSPLQLLAFLAAVCGVSLAARAGQCDLPKAFGVANISTMTGKWIGVYSSQINVICCRLEITGKDLKNLSYSLWWKHKHDKVAMKLEGSAELIEDELDLHLSNGMVIDAVAAVQKNTLVLKHCLEKGNITTHLFAKSQSFDRSTISPERFFERLYKIDADQGQCSNASGLSLISMPTIFALYFILFK